MKKELEIVKRDATVELLTKQIAVTCREIEGLKKHFDECVEQENYGQATKIAAELIKLLYSIYEKQMEVSRAHSRKNN